MVEIGNVGVLVLGALIVWSAGALHLWAALRRGSIWTLIGMALLAAGIALAFSFVFVVGGGFHFKDILQIDDVLQAVLAIF